MDTKWMKQTLSMVACSTLMITGMPTELLQAQSASQQAAPTTSPAVAPLTSSQLDSLVAPIALYPDALVAQVLAAASYPEEVAFADDWLTQNQNLQGDALAQAVNQQPWDPSVKALTQFPSVLHNLAKNLSWTSSLGQAFENQQADVMAAVQFMRAKAQAAGTLQSSSEIKVVQQSPQTIIIEPANSNVVYVPQYNPAVVYGAPLVVPAYAPPVAVAAAGISFGAGVAIGAAFGGGGFVAGGFGGGGWGFGAWGVNWGGGGGGGGTINYNHNTYITRNNITRNNVAWNSNNHNNNGNRNNNNGNRSNNWNQANNHYNGGRPDVPNGGRNGDHGLIGGNGGVQHQPDDYRADRPGSQQFHSPMSGNGEQARAEANRGRGSMHPAAYQRQRQGMQRQQHQVRQPRQQQREGGERRGERR
jgi:hypothetical protein